MMTNRSIEFTKMGIIMLGLISSIIVMSCSKSDKQTEEEAQTTIVDESDTDPTGTYEYENGQGKTRLRVRTSSWVSTTTITSGFGEDYDNSQAMINRGIVKNNDLYDESGYVKVGRLWRNANKKWAADLDGSGGSMTLFKQ